MTQTCSAHCGYCGRCSAAEERPESRPVVQCGTCGETIGLFGHSIAGVGVFCSAGCSDIAINLQEQTRDYFVGFGKAAAR